MPDALPAPFCITVPTSLVFVRSVRKMIEAVLVAQGWGEDDVDDAALVITEILQNSIEHGSRCDGAEHVRVTCSVLKNAVELDVEDPGTGKDPSEALRRDPAAIVPLEATRGRGLFLINKLCSSFERSLQTEGGLRVRVRRECDAS